MVRNQPVKNIETEKVAITSQNHGFAADKEKLEKMGAIVTEYNLNDQTVSGMRIKDLPVFSVQYHPKHPLGRTMQIIFSKHFISWLLTRKVFPNKYRLRRLKSRSWAKKFKLPKPFGLEYSGTV